MGRLDGVNGQAELTLYRAFVQHVDLSGVDLRRWTLDIGGGGEGIIGQLNPDVVISIDPSMEELMEASRSCLKAVMDARNLSFLV